ncbi:MAG TPA: hypothetical protein VML35_07750 [Gaiellaceae bacterium]|nr:hypothetical protein [Gaiellaceae bacterium]
MKRLLPIALLLALFPAAGAAGVRPVTAPAPVLALEHDGSFVAYAVGRSARDCNRVYVWNLATRGVSKLGRKTHCIETSTGNAIGNVAVAGRRVLWVHFAGGNRRLYTLWTATTTAPLPRLLASREVDVDDAAPIVIGQGDDSALGSLLPYAVGRTVVALRANGSRAFTWTAPTRVVGLSAHRGELAVAMEGGTVTVLGERARLLRVESYATEVQEVRLTGNAVLVQRGRTLELRGGRTGSWPVPAGNRLLDAEGNRAVLSGGGRVRTLDLRDGRIQVVAPGTLARIEGARLSIGSGRLVSVR